MVENIKLQSMALGLTSGRNIPMSPYPAVAPTVRGTHLTAALFCHSQWEFVRHVSGTVPFFSLNEDTMDAAASKLWSLMRRATFGLRGSP